MSKIFPLDFPIEWAQTKNRQNKPLPQANKKNIEKKMKSKRMEQIERIPMKNMTNETDMRNCRQKVYLFLNKFHRLYRWLNALFIFFVPFGRLKFVNVLYSAYF